MRPGKYIHGSAVRLPQAHLRSTHLSLFAFPVSYTIILPFPASELEGVGAYAELSELITLDSTHADNCRPDTALFYRAVPCFTGPRAAWHQRRRGHSVAVVQKPLSPAKLLDTVHRLIGLPNRVVPALKLKIES